MFSRRQIPDALGRADAETYPVKEGHTVWVAGAGSYGSALKGKINSTSSDFSETTLSAAAGTTAT